MRTVSRDPRPRDGGFPARPEPPLPIAISQCLLGSTVRYDGSEAGFALPHAALAGVFQYRGICPEVGIGLGTPREPIRLVGDVAVPRVLGVNDPTLDVTAALREYARSQAALLDEVAGYVFMRGSPSCGLFDVKVYPVEDGVVGQVAVRSGRGGYAAAVVAARPTLPVEENGRLHDPLLRENFVVRTFAYAHWRALERAGISRARLIEFHSRYKYLLMAHSVPHYQQAGRLLSNLDDLQASADAYVTLLMTGLFRVAGRRGHANVLAHLHGYFKRHLDGPRRRELDGLIHAYRRGEVPLRQPLDGLRDHLRRYPDAFVEQQAYLDLYGRDRERA